MSIKVFEIKLLKIRGTHAIGIACLCVLSLCLVIYWASRSKAKSESHTNLAAAASLTPNPKPLVAFLNEGNLWVIQSDGANRRMLAMAPEGEAIQDFVWSQDGSRVYFSIGLQIFEIMVQPASDATKPGNVTFAGLVTPPPGLVIDHLEMASDGRTIIVHMMGANAVSRLLGLTIGEGGSCELSIDEYFRMTQPQSQVVRNIGEYSVSPDARRVLFKMPVDKGEELFVADVESGARMQITHLYELSGFEGSTETEGGRRVIEATWSPDGRYIIFNSMQSCSELMLCYGRLYLVEAWGGRQRQLSTEMMVDVPQEWNGDGSLLLYDDGGKVVVTDTYGKSRTINEGNHAKWQPGR